MTIILCEIRSFTLDSKLAVTFLVFLLWDSRYKRLLTFPSQTITKGGTNYLVGVLMVSALSAFDTQKLDYNLVMHLSHVSWEGVLWDLDLKEGGVVLLGIF